MLDLCENIIGDAGAARLAEALPACLALEVLDPYANGTEDAGTARMADTRQRAPRWRCWTSTKIALWTPARREARW